MWVTIIADASFCPDTGKAGYGFWIASQRGKMGGDGVLKGIVENNIAAEIMALLNALHAARKSELVLQNDSVLLQTDCQPAIDALRRQRQSITEQEMNLVAHYESFCEEHSLHIRLKHVKGHSDKEDARYVVNNICDRKARRNMRQARDEYKDQQIREFLNDQSGTKL
jgi:ribonuclease HI